MIDDIEPLFDIDSPIFTFAEPNVGVADDPYYPPWSDLFEDIISVGAWNVDPGNYSLITDSPNLTETDILADGAVEYGDQQDTLTGWLDLVPLLPRRG